MRKNFHKIQKENRLGHTQSETRNRVLYGLAISPLENSRRGQLFSSPSSGVFLPLLPLHPNLKGEHLKGGKFIVQIIQLAAEDTLIVPPFVLQRLDLGDPAVHHRRAGDVGVDEVLHPFLVKLHLPAHGDVELLGHLVPLLLVVQHIHTVDDELAAVLVVGVEGLDEVLEQRHLLHMGAGDKEQLAVDGDGKGLHPGEEKVGQTFHLLAGGTAFIKPEQFLRLLAVVPGVHQAVQCFREIPQAVDPRHTDKESIAKKVTGNIPFESALGDTGHLTLGVPGNMDPGLSLGPQGKALGWIAGKPAVLHAALGPVGPDLHPLDIPVLVVDGDEIPTVPSKGPRPIPEIESRNAF